MNDRGGVTLETETPVNPYSLLEAVNRSSDSVNAAWLIFLALMSYLLITVAGVTDKDLLLNSDIELPILQIKIDLTRFFLFAPILLVLLHVGVIGQLVLLARKTLEFAAAIRMLEASDQRTHPLRLELDNFFFVQAMAGPERSRVMSIFLNGMSWLTLVLLPLLLLLYVQLAFLPYHDITITWVHRLAVLADVALLVFIGVFLLRSETSFFRAFLGTSRYHPVGLVLTAAVLALVAVFVLFVATIPGEPLERVAGTRPTEARAGGSESQHLFGFALPVVGPRRDGAILGLFRRNLHVTDVDLVVDKDVAPGEPSLSLRDRDLRFARLDRTDLHQADLSGSDLSGASLVGADLRNVWLQCADLDVLLLWEDRRAARCATARQANFSHARLMDARMAGADLTGAKLEEANLEGAVLAHARLSGGNFTGALMNRTDLSDASALGANFLLASLQGADLSGARLLMADFGSALMQGGNLTLASLEGAMLRNAEMEGASLAMSRLHGADMTGAKMEASDMTGAFVWRTAPPGGEVMALADMAQIVMHPPSEQALAKLRETVADLDAGPLKTRLMQGVEQLVDAGQNTAWATSAHQRMWLGLASASQVAAVEGYKARLTDHLAQLMCRTRWSNGAVATGIARRAMAPGFKGDMPAIYDRLKGPNCPASSAMSAHLMHNLAAAAEAARGQ